MSRIQGSLRSGSRQWSRCRLIQAAPASSSIAAKARRTASSLTILLMSSKLGQHAVAAQRRDMRIALVAGQHRQHRRPQHVARLGRVRARVVQRAIRDERLEQTRRLQKIDEERQLAERRESRRMVPFDPHRTGETVHNDGAAGAGPKRNRRLFTRRVNANSAKDPALMPLKMRDSHAKWE